MSQLDKQYSLTACLPFPIALRRSNGQLSENREFVVQREDPGESVR
jgi:hypothetical protein